MSVTTLLDIHAAIEIQTSRVPITRSTLSARSTSRRLLTKSLTGQVRLASLAA